MNEWRKHVPPGFKLGDKAPPDCDLDWFAACLTTMWPLRVEWNVLEFGCGVTSILIDRILKPHNYLMLETYLPAINGVGPYIWCAAGATAGPGITDICPAWSEIPRFNPYNFVLIDSSSGCGQPGGHHRDLSLKAAIPYLEDDAIVLFHDAKHAEGKKVQRVIDRAEQCWKWWASSVEGRGWKGYQWVA